MPVPGTILALAIGIDMDVVFELIDMDIIIEDVIMVLLRVSRARHAMSLSLGALMLKRMPRSQWSLWPQ